MKSSTYRTVVPALLLSVVVSLGGALVGCDSTGPNADETDSTPPAAPSDVNGVAGDGEVGLSWSIVEADDLDGYNVYRSTSSISDISGINPVNGSSLSDSSYTDTDVSNGTMYYYVVTAVDGSGNESDPSSEVTATPSNVDSEAPSSPSGLTGQAGDATVDLAWDDVSATDLDGYNVYRSTSSISDVSGMESENGSTLSQSSYTDNDVSNGTTYHYVVTSVDGSGNESDASNEVTATPSSGDGNSSGDIVFVSDRDGDEEIYTIASDGSNLQQITDNSARDTDPAWSPDGSQIAFSSDRGQYTRVYVMNSDGSNLRQLTDNTENSPDNDVEDYEPAWSPDGAEIAFVSDRGDDHPRVYVINTDGTNTRQVTEGQDGRDFDPAWKPDGSRIAFASDDADAGDDSDLFSIQPDGTNENSIIGEYDAMAYDDESPAWKPDGSRVAFHSDRDGSGIFTVAPDGSNQKQITDSGALPAWKPDGTRIVYVESSSDYNQNLHIVSPDGSGRTQLTDNSSDDSEPDWRSQ